MRFASFTIDGANAWGAVDNENAFVTSSVMSQFHGLRDVIAAGALTEAWQCRQGVRAIPLASVQWQPVVPDPSKILCVGLNYESHRNETRRAATTHPTFFIRFADSQIGHRSPMLMPSVSTHLDYEGELAVIIGIGGKSIPAAAAFQHIGGFAAYNDGSVRDWQRHTTQWAPGKNFAGTGAFGPWMVTPDEYGSFAGRRIRTLLNGEIKQDAILDDMIFDVAHLIEYASTFTALSPGDVIVTGTPGGVGAMKDPPQYMKPGDIAEVMIDGLGTLSNVISREQ